MAVRWTVSAERDLMGIYRHIAQDQPEVALEIVRELYASIQKLEQFPSRGRVGRLKNTRELVVARLPYIAVYTLAPSMISRQPDVQVLRVIHGAMQWPAAE